MTFARFRQLWDCLVTDRQVDTARPAPAVPYATSPVSPHTEAALIRAANGDHSTFDEISAKLARHDHHP